MSDAQYKPGVYVKGDSEKVANTPARAVALVFDGYTLKETVPAESASYRDLQAQAKELGIPANQSEGALREAIAAATPSTAVTTVDESDES
jgi:hypothetical protein